MHLSKYSVLFILQSFLVLVNAELAVDSPQNEPNITVASFPTSIEFSIEDPNYIITKVDCDSVTTIFYSKVNCTNLEPCSSYLAKLEIEFTNSTSNKPNIITKEIQVKTTYKEPKVKLMEDYISTPYTIYLKWDVKYPNCVNLFTLKATSENKVYMEIKNDKSNVTLQELNPCQTYDIEFVTIDINNNIIEPNLTTYASTDYDEPGSVSSLDFHPKSNKSVQVSWVTPNYTTCIKHYNLRWIKSRCLDQEPISCNWQEYIIKNPKSTDHLIDNLEGCEEYTFEISINGTDKLINRQMEWRQIELSTNVENRTVIGTFLSPEQRPGQIADYLIVNSTATNVIINWNKPIENGECVSKYEVHMYGPLQNISINETIKTNNRNITFNDLKPCGIYNISITAISENLISNEVNNTITMMHAKPNPVQKPNIKYYYPYEILLEWQKPNFSELCIDHYRISGWSSENINDTNYSFSNETKLNEIQVSQLASCMSYIVQIIPVISGTEPPFDFDGNPIQLEFETIATPSLAPIIDKDKIIYAAHSLTISVKNNDEQNKCPILIAKYQCRAPDAKINYIEKTVQGESGKNFEAILEPLSPFTEYLCVIYFYNIAGKSVGSVTTAKTDIYYPDEPTDLKVVGGNGTLIVNWNKPIYLNGDLKFYKVFLQIVGPQYKLPLYCKSFEKKNIFNENSRSEFIYGETLPFYQYSIQVAAGNNFGTGKLTNPFFFTTKPAAAMPVENLKYVSIDGPSLSDTYEASVLLKWQAPCVTNGVIKLYEIHFHGIKYGVKDHCFVRNISSLDVIDATTFIELNETNLLPEYNYTVEVTIEIFGVDEKSKPMTINFLSPAGIPDIVNDTNSGKVDAYSSTNPTNSALVKMPITVFRSNVGKIIYAAVLLSEIGCQDDPQLQSGKIEIEGDWPDIPNWQEVNSDNCVKQYQTTPKRWQPFNNDKKFNFKNNDLENYHINSNDIIEFVIGTENNCKSDEHYCNGPLKPDTKYKMILRVFTRNGYADTVSLEFKTDEIVQVFVILIMVISILLIAFLSGFIYMWINKRKIWYRQSLNGIEDQCGDVTTRNYLLHYNDLSKNDKILREFKDLDVVSNDTNSKNIITKYNDLKNRYSNIFPYENNRVILDIDADGSDYINASFINGYKRKKEYIATQGPKPESFVDFWKMIIQHNVRIIVMLTQLYEDNVIKCHQYFPIMSNEVKFGNNITVYCKREIKNDIYERRDLIIKHSGDHIYRNIVHYYFKKWPDHDCPSDPIDLITFVKRIKTEKIPNRSPIVVHCSAGVGRTGTFIGLDIIMQRMKNEGKINIYETVKQLRFERMKMVQTLQQYQFLYNCIYQLVLNKYSSDSKKNSIITNNSSTTTMIIPSSNSLSRQCSQSTICTPTSTYIPTNCNGNNLIENNNNHNIYDTNSSRNSIFNQNDIESVM